MTPRQTVLGLGVGAGRVQVGVVTRTGSVIRSHNTPLEATDQKAALEGIETALLAFMQHWDGPAPQAIGVGLDGLVDPRKGAWLHSASLPVRSALSLAERWRGRYGLPVAMDDLVHAAALAELRWGAGREAQDFVFLEIGTSVAAGLVCDGRLVRGTANLAGEFGHVFVDPDGPLCSCGRCGCLEPLVSAGGLLQQVRVQLLGHPASSLCALPPDELTPGAVLRAAQAGDSLASAVAGRAAHALGLALAGLIDLLNPRLVVCSGPVLADDWLRQRVVAEVEARAKPVTLKSFKGLLPTRLDPELSTLLGGASLAWDSLPGQAAASPT